MLHQSDGSMGKECRHLTCRRWLSARAAQAASYGKPFVIEEFGKYIPRPATSDEDIKRIRDPWFEDVFSIVDGSIKSGGPIHGQCAVSLAACTMVWCRLICLFHSNGTSTSWLSPSELYSASLALC